MRNELPSEFSRYISTFDIGSGETSITISADSTEREALAKRFSLKKLDFLSATLNFSRSEKKELIMLKVKYVSEITQTCVVTLESITDLIQGEFTSYLVKMDQYNNDKNFIFEFDDVDQIELVEDGYFDAGELVSEFLSLEIDPFPRSNAAKSGEAKYFIPKFDVPNNNPFHLLKKLQAKEK